MTDRSVSKGRLRRPLWLLAGLLSISVVLGAWLFVANFDLDQYREQIAAKASEQLGMPVRIGHARLVFREAGLACRLTDVAIGSPQTSRELVAGTVWLQLAWEGVIKRQPIFSEIALNDPRLRLAIEPTVPADMPPAPAEADEDWLEDFGISRIEVHRGTLELSWRSLEQPALRRINLYAIDLEVDNLAKGDTLLATLSAELSKDPSRPERIDLKGSVELLSGRPLAVGSWEILAKAREVAVAPLVALLEESWGVQGGGTANLALNLHGKGTDSAAIEARLDGAGLRLRPGPAYRQALPLRTLQLAGEWQRTAEGHSLRNVVVQLDEARLTGTMTHHEDDRQHELLISLGKSTLPLATILPWVPEALYQKLTGLQRLQPQGELAVDEAECRAAIPKSPKGLPLFAFQKMKGLASHLLWKIPDVAPLEIVRMPISLGGGAWQIDRTELRLGKLPVQLSGAFTQQEAAPPRISLTLQSHGDVAHLAEFAARQLPQQLQLAGEFDFSGQLDGPVHEMAFDLKLDLAKVHGRYGETVTLPATPGAAWAARGALTPSKLLVAQSTLNLAPLTSTLHGELDWSAEPAVNFDTTLAIDDLTSLHQQLPALAEAGVRGGVAIALKASGPLAAPNYQGSCTLNDLGLPMHGVIADISGVRGQLQIDGRRLQGDGLAALIGRSPVKLRINVPDLTSPHLDLKVQTTAIRADELIFRSDTRMLRDLDARLLIDGDGISFAPIHVRLDQGTRATIRGSVKSFTAPKVDLSITGEYANVGEIIALWSEESEAAEAARRARHAGSPPAALPPIRIEVKANRGDLYGMQFSEARTVIVPTDERLLLHPLDFKVGDGYCSTQVLLDYTGSSPLLRVSGHIENIDAYEVYNELLERKSLIRGTLRGDFMLQGELGEPGSQRFLSTSFGNLRFTVSDGILRQSPLIGALFSVLNLTQLVQGKLPDINREGVPFSLLTGNMSLDRGILHCKTLVIKSNALDMSYLGQFDLIGNQLDLLVVVKPMRNFDRLVSNLPVAGWILAGEERTFLTAQFKVTGPGDDPKVEAIPITTLSKGVLGIIQRTLSLPYTLVTDPAILWGQGGKKQ